MSSKIYYLLTKAGYYSLNVYDYIKHLSDRRGAHIDFTIAPLVKIMKGNSKGKNITAVQGIALLLILTVRKEFLEVKGHWTEMDELLL